MGLKIKEEDKEFTENVRLKFDQMFSVILVENWSLFTRYLFLVFLTFFVFLVSVFYSLKDFIFLRCKKIPKRFRQLYLLECILREKLKL
jgi:hypothetical protein